MTVQVARATAERLVARLGLHTPPIDVAQIAKSLGVGIVYGQLGPGVSGLLVSRNQSASIAVKSSDPPVRRRFTIAHEIGHFLLRHYLKRNELVHADENRQIVYRNPQASEGFDPLEVQANQFAASLLMPERLVREHAEKTAKPLSEKDVKILASAFRVSEQAMTIRLSVLGLV
jgi:Zn-dependent peptidase ImmA (M78 family)